MPTPRRRPGRTTIRGTPTGITGTPTRSTSTPTGSNRAPTGITATRTMPTPTATGTARIATRIVAPATDTMPPVTAGPLPNRAFSRTDTDTGPELGTSIRSTTLAPTTVTERFRFASVRLLVSSSVSN